MNITKNQIILTGLTALLISSPQYAAAASAQVTIDWNSLSVQYLDFSGGANLPHLSWTYGLGTADTSASTASANDFQQDSQFAEDLVTTLSINSTTAHAQSSVLRSDSKLLANVSSQTGSNLSGINQANASSYNYAEFELLGNGTAQITLDWSVSAFGTLGNWDDYAYAAAFINGNFNDGNSNIGSSTSNTAYYTGEQGDYNFNGTFTMNVFGDGIHIVSGAVNAEAVAFANSQTSEVPVPNALLLFGSGLIGLLGVYRKRQFQIN